MWKWGVLPFLVRRLNFWSENFPRLSWHILLALRIDMWWPSANRRWASLSNDPIRKELLSIILILGIRFLGDDSHSCIPRTASLFTGITLQCSYPFRFAVNFSFCFCEKDLILYSSQISHKIGWCWWVVSKSKNPDEWFY